MRWSVTRFSGKVVGADPLAAVAGADQRFAFAGPLVVLVLALGFVQPGLEHAQGLGEVLVLALFVLALDDDAGFQVRQPDGRGGLVDVLAAGAAGAKMSFAIVVGLDVDFDVFRLGQHGDGGGRGVDAALGFGLGHALHAVAAAFVLQLAIGPSPSMPRMISLKPPSSVAFMSRTSTFQPLVSA